MQTAHGSESLCLIGGWRIWFAFCFLLLGMSRVQADRNLSELDLKTERVIIFKDGHALVVKRGTVVANEQEEVYTTEAPDAAVPGSFWAVPKDG